MSRVFLSFALAALLACPAASSLAFGGGPPIDPSALGQQVQAQAIDGQLEISRQQTHMVQEVETRTEARTKLAEVDGEKREVTFTVDVPVTVSKPVTSLMRHKVALENVQAFDMQGKQVTDEQLAESLSEERTVLLASRKVPRYYLTVYKPDTLLLVIAPQDLYGPPHPIAPAALPLPPGAGIAPGKPDAPRTLPAPIPAPGEAPPKADAPPALPAPKPAAPRTLPAPAIPAPPGDAPPALPAPAREAPAAAVAPGKEVAPLIAAPGLEPQVSMARIVDDKLGLRRYVKDISSETALREEEVDGVKKLVPVAIEIESIYDVERKYPQDLLKIYRADKKPLAEDELSKLKETERCVLVSSDGKEVDARFLKIVKPEALIVVAPVTPSQSQRFAPLGPATTIVPPARLPAAAPLPPAP